MAFFAVPFISSAEVNCNRAAEHAFPVNKVSTVLLAIVFSIAHIFQEARLADKVFLFRRGLHSHFLLAVDDASKVWLRALSTLEKASFGFGEGIDVVVVLVAWGD